MKLKELLDSKLLANSQIGELEITGISSDSRKIMPGDLFFAFPPAQEGLADGVDFIPAALKLGASLVIADIKDQIKIQNKISDKSKNMNSVLFVENVRKVFGFVASAFYGHPSAKMKVLGITGTNGKTTSTYLIEGIYKANSRKCGVIGTVNYRYDDVVIDASNTTPEANLLERLLLDMSERKVEACAMEVSSHALELSRVDGVEFDTVLFTNLTQDHLDFHKTMDAYYHAKRKLFSEFKYKKAVISVDDTYGERMREAAFSRGIPSVTFGLRHGEVMPKNLKCSIEGIEADFGGVQIKSKLVGWHNVSNILGVVLAAQSMGVSNDEIKTGIESIKGIPGRLEGVESNTVMAFVDYAHTPDALKNVLQCLESIRKNGSRIITVFGCGGDRDKSKRPIMGDIACKLSNIAIVTSDNPRMEDASQIIRDIAVGMKDYTNYKIFEDRKEAIQNAVKMAKPGDIILVAGKGHENYQIIGKTKHHFDDREELALALKEISK